MQVRRGGIASSLFGRVQGFWRSRRRVREIRVTGWEPCHERKYREEEDGKL